MWKDDLNAILREICRRFLCARIRENEIASFLPECGEKQMSQCKEACSFAMKHCIH